MNRRITDLTLERVSDMAANAPSKALRVFHAEQLKDLRRRSASQRRSRCETSFDRFIQHLEK